MRKSFKKKEILKVIKVINSVKEGLIVNQQVKI